MNTHVEKAKEAGNKKSNPWITAAAAVAVFFALNILASNLFTSSRLDLTSDRLYTLSDGSKNILAELSEPIQLRYYYSAKLVNDIPSLQSYGNRVRDLLEEFASNSNGKVRLDIIDPAPFSEAEDEAVGYGIRQLPISATGEVAYLGIVGTNSTDDLSVLPYLAQDQEDALEYEVTKLIYNLANPTKRTIGVISPLPLFGLPPSPVTQSRPANPWTMIQVLQESFEMEDLGTDLESIGADIDTVLVVHPKELPRKTVYAIDQFVLGGGKAMVFVDPLAEADNVQPDPENPMVMPETSSDLPNLLKQWGVEMVKEKIVGDPDAAIRVQYQGSRGGQTIEYLPWLSFTRDNLNREDFITNQLNQVNLGSAGFLVPVEGASTSLEPLLFSGPGSGEIERDTVFFARDPGAMLNNFEADGKSRWVAVRINGPVSTAFPDGRPRDIDEKRAAGKSDHLTASTSTINVVVFADVDILADRFWVRVENFLGVSVPSPFADNADLIFNALDNLGGNDDLIGLRSRGRYARPFEVVNDIQKRAEAKFRDQERELTASLQQTEQKIAELQSQRSDTSNVLLSPEQRAEIDNFRAQQLDTRKKLRAVQHNLQREIERLGTVIKFLNIGLVPLLILLAAIVISFSRAKNVRSA